jgi:hypothetical protein
VPLYSQCTYIRTGEIAPVYILLVGFVHVYRNTVLYSCTEAQATVTADLHGNYGRPGRSYMWTRVGVGLGCVASGGGVDWQPTCSWPTGGR